MDNLHAVLHQLEAFGIKLKSKDLDKIHSMGEALHLKSCGAKGKDYLKFSLFRPDAGGCYVTGYFGTYRHGGSWQKIEHDWAPLSEAERDRQKFEREAAAARAAVVKAKAKRIAALQASDLWHMASRTGRSPYLERKGLEGEACRYLPDGTLVLLLLRYDLPREEAVQAAQRILPTGEKYYTKGFSKPGSALRLGTVANDTQLLLVCEGYATGLTCRLATDRRFPVFVAFDAGNLAHVVPLIRELHPDRWVLICADDDHLTRDPITEKLNNPGRTAAKAIAKQTPCVDIVYPIFDRTRQAGDTDFDDLRMRQGLPVVARQLQGVIQMMERVHG
ncbi:hypothetical protein BH11PSE13_BH11PSE13_12350 [soil metagenome]